MKAIQRMMPNICSGDLQKSKAFYTHLFNFQIGFESDWFFQLFAAEGGFELGSILRSLESLPDDFKHEPKGIYLIFVVDDADHIFEAS